MIEIQNKGKDLQNTLMERVVIHPTVLLTIVDHFGHDSKDRVLGVVLGRKTSEGTHIETCFALPYTENDDEWYLDTSYQKNMYSLFKKINDYEICGWYHTGSENAHNRQIMNYFATICDNPLLLIVDVNESSKKVEYPVKTYRIENSRFIHVDSVIEAEEAEEVGVEHLLSDIRDEAEGHLADEIHSIKEAMSIYDRGLKKIALYLIDSINGKNLTNENILNELQILMCIKPKFNVDSTQCNLKEVYLACIAKNVIKLNDMQRERLQGKTSV